MNYKCATTRFFFFWNYIIWPSSLIVAKALCTGVSRRRLRMFFKSEELKMLFSAEEESKKHMLYKVKRAEQVKNGLIYINSGSIFGQNNVGLPFQHQRYPN